MPLLTPSTHSHDISWKEEGRERGRREGRRYVWEFHESISYRNLYPLLKVHHYVSFPRIPLNTTQIYISSYFISWISSFRDISKEREREKGRNVLSVVPLTPTNRSHSASTSNFKAPDLCSRFSFNWVRPLFKSLKVAFGWIVERNNFGSKVFECNNTEEPNTRHSTIEVSIEGGEGVKKEERAYASRKWFLDDYYLLPHTLISFITLLPSHLETVIGWTHASTPPLINPKGSISSPFTTPPATFAVPLAPPPPVWFWGSNENKPESPPPPEDVVESDSSHAS